MLGRALRRLAGLGVTDPEVGRVQEYLDAACEEIRASCGLERFPNPLQVAAVEMAAGAYLRDAQAGLVSVSMGDTEVKFDSALINRLENAKNVCAYYRRVRF